MTNSLVYPRGALFEQVGMVLRARLCRYRHLAPQVRHFEFELVEGTLDFQPGQHVGVVGESENGLVVRPYSIASPPGGSRFELCVRKVPGGLFSEQLFLLEPGHEILITPPRGSLQLRFPVRRVLFIATGTAVAPFRSMLLAPEMWQLEPEVTLLFGARAENELFYKDEFEKLASEHPQFRYVPVLSRPSASWPGRRGWVQDHIAEVLGQQTDWDVYLCGWPEMIRQAREKLRQLGIREERVYDENTAVPYRGATGLPNDG